MSQAKRQQKQHDREMSRLIEMRQVDEMLQLQEKELKDNIKVIYTLIVANVLSAKPYGFGKKRIHNVLNEFFEKVDGLADKSIDIKLVLTTAQKYGIDLLKQQDGSYLLDLK